MATLTVADYLLRMKQAIGNANPSTGFTLLDVLNEAVQYVFTYNNWSWRERPPALCNLVATQTYVSLPSDFGNGGELDAVASIWSPITVVHITSVAEIARLRGLPLYNSLEFYVAVSFPTQASVTTAPPQPQLEVWPTPQASITGAFRIVYRAGYVTLTSNTQVPNVPPEFTAALTLTARAMTLRYESGSDNPQALAEFAAANAELDRLKDNDGLSQSDMGHISPGAAAAFLPQRNPGWWRPFTTIPVR